MSEVDALLKDVGYTPPLAETTPADVPKTEKPVTEKFGTKFVREDKATFPMGIRPTKENSFVEYVTVNPQQRESLDSFVNKRNSAALAGGVPIDSLKGGKEFIKQNESWHLNLYSPSRLAEIKRMGAIGMIEAGKFVYKEGLEDVLPYADAVDIAKNVNVFRVMQKIKNDPSKATPGEKKLVYEYLDTQAQMQIRGFDLGGNIVYNFAKMPKFAIELATVAASWGGLAPVVAGKQVAKTVVKKSISEMIEKGAKASLAVGTRGLLTTVAPKTIGTGYVMYSKLGKHVSNQYVNDSFAITDKGQAFFKEATLSPTKAVFKAIGSTWIENSTEMAGAFLFKPFGQQVAARLPKGFGKGFQELVEKYIGVKYTKAVAKFGYDGVLEELGEERLADFLSTATGLEGEITPNKLANSIFHYEDPDRWLLDIGVVTLFGASSYATAKVIDKVSTGKTPEEIKQNIKDVESLTETQKDLFVKQIEQKETEKDIAEYTQKIDDFKSMVGENVPRETLDANVAIWDNMITVLANKTGKTRSELAEDLPMVKAMKQGEMTGLFQKELNDFGIQPVLFEKYREIENKVMIAESKLNDLAKGSKSEGGLVPDEIKNTPEYKQAESDFEIAFSEQQAFNLSKDGKALQKSLKKLDPIQRQKLRRGELFQSELKAKEKTFTPEFMEWFGKSKNVVNKDGTPKVLYSGHSNVSMYGDAFDPKKATAGGFYATEDPAIAGSYAEGKWGVKESYENGEEYRLEAKNGKITKKIYQVELSEEQRNKIDELIKYDEETGEGKYHLNDMVDYIKSNKDYDKDVRRWSYTGGVYRLQNIFEFYDQMGYTINTIKDDSHLPPEQRKSMAEKVMPNDFEDLLDVLKIKWDSRQSLRPGIIPVYLKIDNPIDTSKPFPKDLLNALKEKAKREKVVPDSELHDLHWTKNYPLREWVKDIENDDGGHGWATMVPTKAKEIIQSFGYDGIKDVGGKTGGIQHGVWIAFESNQVKSAFNLKPTDRPGLLKQGAKGAFNAKNNIIALFETADRSTFLHESAHAFFEMYLKHLPTELNTVMKWAGFEGKSIENLTDKQYVKLQESFATGFEMYLREGKAPSMQLADAFERFKDWLTTIYETVQDLIQTSGLNIKLNDDIKKFYDEMLAIPADRVAEIDTRTPEEIERDLTLFQNEKKKEAEKLFKEMPISEVFSGKIRLTPESKGLMDRYDVPVNLRTKSETAKTLDEWADTLKMSEEQVLEEVAKIGSKTKFINDYVEKAKEQAKYEKSFEAKTASEIKSQGISKAPVSEDIYDKNYQLNSQELKFSDELKENAGEVGKAGAEWANRAFVPLSSRLKKISPKLQQLVRRFEYDTLQAQHKQAKEIFPFLEKYSALEVKDARDLDFALKVSDITKINEIVERNGMRAEYDSVVKLLENIYDSARDAGLDFGFLIDYFPRKVENYDEFKTFLKGTNEWTAIEEALKQKAIDLQRPMTAEEQAEYVSGMLRGFGKGKILLSKPDNTEQRKIGEITPEMNAFYKDSSQALIEYVRSMTETIEARKLFGKSEKDIETSIGNVINQMIKAGELDRKDEVAAKKILTARFNQKGTSGIWAMYKTMNYLTLLGSPISAITQIEDIGLTMYRAGIFNTGKSLLNSIMNTPKVTLESIGVENIAEEFSEKTFGQKAIETVFKITGFTWMDKLGKESFVNGIYSKYEGLAKSNDSNFIDMLGQVFGEEADQVLTDLKTGTISENVKYLLFNELAGIQPITLSEMPELYVTGGNSRVYYALKTFTIKRFDYLRTHAIEQIQADPVKGIANLTRMVLFLMLAGASTDWIKDFLLGRKTPPEDYVVNNLFKVFGLQKWVIYQARREGLMAAFSRQILPPFKLIDDIYKDVMAITMNENPRSIKDFDTWSNVPLVGKLYYWWFGRGSEKK